ncbi:MAG TPA: hypothetical protein GXX51_02065 [Firmicutes bacterium]|nr:hypothetical protein [Bacillota bacterium]
MVENLDSRDSRGDQAIRLYEGLPGAVHNVGVRESLHGAILTLSIGVAAFPEPLIAELLIRRPECAFGGLSGKVYWKHVTGKKSHNCFFGLSISLVLRRCSLRVMSGPVCVSIGAEHFHGGPVGKVDRWVNSFMTKRSGTQPLLLIRE